MDKTQRIIEYILKLNDNPENPSELFQQYKDDLLNVESHEAFDVFREVQKEHYSEVEIISFLDKIVHIFYNNLKKNQLDFETTHPFIKELAQENRVLEQKFSDMRPLMRQLETPSIKTEMISKLKELKDFFPHYEKKENLLFPLLESVHDRYEGSAIMWALHNQVKEDIDHSIMLCQSETASHQDIIERISQLFFNMLGLIQKEEYILYPNAIEQLTTQQLDTLLKQSKEYPGVFKLKDAQIIDDEHHVSFSDDLIHFPTGVLRLDEVFMIFDTLELDMTYVDEHNKVRYFTRPKDRIFPRSKAVIGRDVKNCHPPQSVDIVMEIVDKFRNNKEDKASFWIDFRGRKVLIEYFALRDAQNKYRGVLEVSSDITEIQKITGQQRLAQYKSSK
ncbi:MAG TPA: DUF438 domain-containing protein [Erysipelothrix sp.]|nr:DUF438 domain-containing protein [Erysipelothrix sp.]